MLYIAGHIYKGAGHSMHYLYCIYISCVSDICLFKCNSESPSSVNDMDMVVFSARRHVSLSLYEMI